MPDGTLLQWGSTTIPSGSYTATAQLPIAFIDKTKIGVSVTAAAVSAGTDYGVNYSGVTENQLSFGRTPNTATNTIYWIAIGRWK